MKLLWIAALGAAQSVAAADATIAVGTQPLATRVDKTHRVASIQRPEAVHAVRATLGSDGRISYNCAAATGADLRFTKPSVQRER